MKIPMPHLSSEVFTFRADITKHSAQPYFNFLKNEISITSGMLLYLRKSLSRGLPPFWFTL